MHIPSQHKDVFSFPTDDGDLPSAKFDLPNRRDVWYLPPGLLSHKPATLKYAGMTLQGTLCLIVSEVHQDFFARFLHIPEDEDPGKLGGSKEPWTLIHPVMGFSWVQAGRILRRVPELEADESAIFIAFTDDIHAFMCLDKLGQCNMDGEYTDSPNPHLILAFPTHIALGTTTRATLRTTPILYDPAIPVYPPCPVDPALFTATRTYLSSGDAHKHRKTHLMPMKSWLLTIFKPWLYSKCTVKPNLAMGAQMGNVTMMSKEEWVQFVHYKNVDEERVVAEVHFQPTFPHRQVSTFTEEARMEVLSSTFKSADPEAEDATWRAQKEISRLAAKGWVPEPDGPAFFD